MTSKVEDGAIVIVPSKDQLLFLGTPYHCGGDEVTVPPETPPIEFDTTCIETLPIRTLNYNLNHIRETKDKTQSLSIGLDVILKTFIGLSLNVGSVQYETKYNSHLQNEHIQVYYYREEEVKRLLPDDEEVIKKIMDDPVYEAASKNATHIVTEVYYGVHLIADILIETSTTSKMVDKSAAGLGTSIMGPISAGIEAGLKALLDQRPDTTNVTINVTCTHDLADFDNITTADQLFEVIKKLDLIPTTEFKPLKMFCVPISQFLPAIVGSKPNIPVISEIFLRPLHEMMSILRDFQPSETEGSSHYLKKVLRGDHRFRVILEDVDNPITIEVLGHQSKWNSTAEGLYTDGEALLKDLSSTEENVITLLENYKTQFSIANMEDEIRTSILEGKKQLSLVSADDIDEFTQAKFFSSKTSLKAYNENMRQDPSPPKVVVELHAKQEDPEAVPAGLFLQIYNLSLAELEVKILMPNVADEFSLTIEMPGGDSQVYKSFDEIMIALDVLQVVFGVAGGAKGKLYLALASKHDIPLPLKPDGFSEEVFNFIKYCITSDDYGQIKIYPTFMSLKQYLLSPTADRTADKIIIALPIASYVPLAQATEAFDRLIKKFMASKKFEFVVGEFDLGNEDAPLLAIFQGGKLQAVCLDWLDFYRLEAILLESTEGNKRPDFSLLNKNASTLHPLRTEFYRELYKLFQFSLYQKPTLVHHPGVLKLEKREDELAISTALEIFSAYLAVGNREEEMVTKLTLKLLEHEPSYRKILEGFEWSEGKGGFQNPRIFGEDHRTQLRGIFLDMLFECSTLLTKLGAFVHTLDFAIQSYLAKEDDAFGKLKLMINGDFLKDIENVDQPLMNKIKTHLQILQQVDAKRTEIVNSAFEAQSLVHGTLIIKQGLVNPDDIKAIHLQSILSVLPPIPPIKIKDSEEPPDPEIRRVTTEDALSKILERFMKTLEYLPELYAEIQGYYLTGHVLKIVDILGEFRYPKWHRTYVNKFRELKEIDNYEGLMGIIEATIEGVDESNLTQMHFIWSNPSFERMILDAFESEENTNYLYESRVFNAVAEVTGASSVWIPDYIPTKVKRALMGYATSLDDLFTKLMRRGPKIGQKRQFVKV